MTRGFRLPSVCSLRVLQSTPQTCRLSITWMLPNLYDPVTAVVCRKEGFSMVLPEPLRVGYVVKWYPRYSETFVVREIIAHEANGLQITIFTLRPLSDSHFQELIARVRAPVHYLPSEGLQAGDFWQALAEARAVVPELWQALGAAQGEEVRDVYQAAVLARVVRLQGIRHLHAPFASTSATVARLAARFAGIPYSFTSHAKDIFHASVRPEDLRGKLSEAAGVITVSEYNLAYLRRTYGAAAAHVQRIYNGLDLEQFRYETPGERPARIVAVGRLVEKKGFADLIEACGLLDGRGRRFECQIIGEGPLEGELQGQIERWGLQGKVELLGPRPESEVMRHMQGAAVFALPCVVGADGNRDGLPTVLLEAMALGTPCVSTDVTGIPEVVRDGETGLAVAQHDPAALAGAIERLLVDPELRVRLAAQARRLVEAEFDIHCNAARVRKVFGAAAPACVCALRELC
jgi:glycosyltransferase involved in cell wall biosynthesis